MGTCIHGQNQRQCDRCEDAAEKATLLADLSAMRKERDNLLAEVAELRKRLESAPSAAAAVPDDEEPEAVATCLEDDAADITGMGGIFPEVTDNMVKAAALIRSLAARSSAPSSAWFVRASTPVTG